jgi:NAD(P)H-flavin reductase
MNAPLLHSYFPTRADVTAIVPESSDTRTFVLEPRVDASRFAGARPGQFVMLSLPGHGEAAFTLASSGGSAAFQNRISLTVRRVGRLTAALFELAPGASLGVRGPFGRGFPDWPAAASLLFVAGGCGLVPLKAAIEARVSEPGRTAAVTIAYGARHPASRIYRKTLDRWSDTAGVAVLECVEDPGDGWGGRVGNVGDLLGDALGQAMPDYAAVCGPPAMMSLVARRLVDEASISPDRVHLAVERQMKCALGTCGRCYVGSRYACRDGPVFSLAELAELDPTFCSDESRRAPASGGGLQC